MSHYDRDGGIARYNKSKNEESKLARNHESKPMTPNDKLKAALTLGIETHFYDRSLCPDIIALREALALLDTHVLVPKEPKLEHVTAIKDYLNESCDYHDDYLHEAAYEIYKITTGENQS
ncbi:MAG: hypothetical protein COB09_18915 [Thalassobium sp.]|nr:MAG: hypothetical protein COB09_18915 [Thalassobium sp.]